MGGITATIISTDEALEPVILLLGMVVDITAVDITAEEGTVAREGMEAEVIASLPNHAKSEATRSLRASASV